MKRFSILFAGITAIILLLTGCKGCHSSNVVADDYNNNPVFNSDPNLRQMTEHIKSNPGDASLYAIRAGMLLKLKMDSLAIKDYQKASSLDTNKAEYYGAIGQILFDDKDINGSLVWFQKALAKDPADPITHLKIANLFLYTRDYAKAFQQIDIALRKDVHNPEGYFLKGMLYKDMKDTLHSISSFQTALQEDPDFRDAAIQLALLYSAKKDPIAMQYLDNAYKKDSTDAFPIFARGVFYQNKGDLVNAKEEYRKCIIKDRHYIDAYFNLGYILMHEDSVEKAFRQYDIVVNLQPDNPTAYYDRGVCYENMKKKSEAIMDYRRAMALDTSYSSPKIALRQLGVLH